MAYVCLMRLASLTLVCVGSVLAAGPASAQGMTAGGLQAMCASRAQQPACASYIQGYMDGRNQSLQRPTVCVPAGTAIGDVAGGFSQHVERNRLEANLQAGLVLGNHLLTNYPCR